MIEIKDMCISMGANKLTESDLSVPAKLIDFCQKIYIRIEGKDSDIETTTGIIQISDIYSAILPLIDTLRGMRRIYDGNF